MRTLTLMALACLITIASPASAEPDPPSPSGGDYSRQFLVGMMGTVVGFYGGALVGAISSAGDREFEDLGRAIVGGLVGASLGTAAGVTWAGNDEESVGHFSAAWAGAGAGTLGAIGWFAATEHESPVLISLGVLFPVLGSMYGHNSSRHLRAEPTETGGFLISWKVQW